MVTDLLQEITKNNAPSLRAGVHPSFTVSAHSSREADAEEKDIEASVMKHPS